MKCARKKNVFYVQIKTLMFTCSQSLFTSDVSFCLLLHAQELTKKTYGRLFEAVISLQRSVEQFRRIEFTGKSSFFTKQVQILSSFFLSNVVWSQELIFVIENFEAGFILFFTISIFECSSK